LTIIYNEQKIDVMEIVYQQQETIHEYMYNENKKDVMEIAYQQQETVTKTTYNYHRHVLAEIGYGELITTSRVIGFSRHDFVKIVYNVIHFAFLGKAFLFDGNNLVEFGSPSIVVFPAIVSSGEKIFAMCGLRENGEIDNIVYGYNMDNYYVVADRNYIAYIIAGEEPVYINDSDGNVVETVKRLGVVPLLKGYRVVSRKPFSLILSVIG